MPHTASATSDPAPSVPASTLERPARLVSLDVLRGLVILAMLIVNNLGDYATTGYFWKHADWREGFLVPSFGRYWSSLHSNGTPWHAFFTQFPLWRHCTLADFVMPMFMLIIGLAIPLSARKHADGKTRWSQVVRRAAMLVLLGWILCYFRDHFAAQLHGEQPFRIPLVMDVLQLLGVSYLFARLLYELPAGLRAVVTAGLMVSYWAFLRFWPQGDVPAGTFTAGHNAARYVYDHWSIWNFSITGWLDISLVGMLSAIPATAMMLIGTFAGQLLRGQQMDCSRRVRALAAAGIMLVLIGIVWALDLPMNKPRWTPCYLVYCAGVGFLVLAGLYWLIEIRNVRRWTPAFVALGVNAISAYFATIMFKVLFLNTPRASVDGQTMSLTNAVITWLKQCLGSAWAGGWTFTLLYVAFWWAILWFCYKRKLTWKV